MIEILKKLIKDYGSALGPILAFFFGILTMIVKYKFDEFIDKRNLLKSFNSLKRVIKDSRPPNYYYPKKSEGLIHADEARNLTNMAIFYNKLIAIREIIKCIDNDINRSRNSKMICQYHNIKWRFDILIRNVEKVRNSKRVDKSSFFEIQNDFKWLMDAVNSVGDFGEYIEPREFKEEIGA